MDKPSQTLIYAFGGLERTAGRLDLLDSMLQPLQDAGKTYSSIYGQWLKDARTVSRSLKKLTNKYRSLVKEREIYDIIKGELDSITTLCDKYAKPSVAYLA
ncbi:MAG: hypothetical protein Q7K45_01110, partial [Nanoarchaeota archaeon]|nr:hypothetical protein [Nanoarchaeota archaeon]